MNPNFFFPTCARFAIALIIGCGGAWGVESGAAGSSAAGQWNWHNGRTVEVRGDGTAEVFNPRTGARESVGEWTQDEASESVLFTWRNGDRHEMTLSGDGGAMRGSIVRRGQTAGSPASAVRASSEPPPVEEETETMGYFGSASPHGNPVPSLATDDASEESEPPAAEADDVYAEKSASLPEEVPVERVATQASLEPAGADLTGSVRLEGDGSAIGRWKEEGVVSWPISHLAPGVYMVSMEHAVGTGRNGGRFELATGSSKTSGLVRPTGGWKAFKRKSLGTVTIGKSDDTLTFTATKVESGAYLMNVQSVELRRQ